MAVRCRTRHAELLDCLLCLQRVSGESSLSAFSWGVGWDGRDEKHCQIQSALTPTKLDTLRVCVYTYT